jgi:hypothetical protein
MKSKIIIKNLEKVIFLGALLISIILIGTYMAGAILRPIEVKEKTGFKFTEPPDKIEGLEKYNLALQQLQKQVEFNEYASYFAKDAFSKYVKKSPPKPQFTLESIQRLPLDLEYKGFIEYSKGIVGQINLEGKTYFVKEGDQIPQYSVLKLYRRYAVVEDPKGNEIRLPLREKIMSDEYQATICLNLEDEIIKVKKGDKIKSYQVLDISTGYVVLFNESTKEKKVLKISS